MFFSVWLICKVVAISFSHRKQCLITTSFDIVPSVPLHLNQFFYLYLFLNIKKVLLLLNTNNLYKLQTSFLNQGHIAINLLTCLHYSPHIHLTSIISRLLLFQIFYIFLRGSYTAIVFLKMLLFWTFWTFNLLSHSTFTWHAPIMSKIRKTCPR